MMEDLETRSKAKDEWIKGVIERTLIFCNHQPRDIWVSLLKVVIALESGEETWFLYNRRLITDEVLIGHVVSWLMSLQEDAENGEQK